MKFYAVVNDVVGGFAVAVKDSPVSELDNRTYHQVICETITMEDAELIARLLNDEWERGWRWELNPEGRSVVDDNGYEWLRAMSDRAEAARRGLI